MKGKNKYIVPLLLAGVTATAGVVTNVNHQQTVVQASSTATDVNVNGAELRMKGGFEDIYQLGGTPITMPEVACVIDGVDVNGDTDDTNDVNIVYKIYRGSKLVAEFDNTSASKEFEPTYTGAYNVKISAEVDGRVVTEMAGLTIMVEKADAVIKLPVNSQYVIPAQLPVSNAMGLTIPAPVVVTTDSEGEEEELSATEAGLVVKLITPNADNSEIVLTLDSEINAYKVTSQQLATAGTYQIRYEYESNDVLVSKLETNFQVVKDLKAPTSLYLKLDGSVPSSGNVNNPISIPKVKVLDSQSSTDGINAHVTIKVIKIANDGTEQGSWEIDYDNYTFTPTEEGNYIVSYQADLNKIYSGVSSSLVKPATIIKVSDKANPTVRPTYAYSVDEDGKITGVDKENDGVFSAFDENDDEDYIDEVLENRKADVPSVVVRGDDGKAKFKLPAIYGTDNKSDYNHLTLTREIVGNNISKITVEAPANEVSEEISLSQTGNYEVRYIATDEAGNKVRATYTLVVKDKDDVKDGETKVKLNIGISSISNKETLKFSAPIVSDTYDSYLDVVVGYKLFNESGVEPLVSETLKKTNADGKYEIKIADLLKEDKYPDATKIIVFASATADSSLAGTREAFKNGNTTTIVEKPIKIINTANDKECATLKVVSYPATEGDENGWEDAKATVWNKAVLEANLDVVTETEEGVEINYIDENGYAVDNSDNILESNGGVKLSPFDQGNQTLTIPEIKFNDSDENLRITLTIQDRFGNIVTKNSYERITKEQQLDNSWDYIVYNASFKMSASGMYTITYRAEDTRGNVVVKSFGIRVNDKTAPTIVIDDEDKYGVDIEVGEFFEVPVGSLIKDGATQDGDVYWDVTCSDGAIAEISSTGFTPLTEGTYYITYTGLDTADNMQILQDNSLFYVNAKDTTAPVFNDDSSYILPATKSWNPDTNGEMNIDIPMVLATDPIKNKSVDVVYSVTAPDGSKITVKDYEEDKDVRYFVAKKQGIYTITYTATDESNNKVTMTKEIAIGDCEAPTIQWKDEANNIPTSMKLGETFELKLGDLTISDNVTTDLDVLEDKMTITLLKPDGTTSVTNQGSAGKNYKWALTDTGAYTLRIVVEDEAGMSNTYKYTINVEADDIEDNKVSSKWGIIILIGTIVILAGALVIFFVSQNKGKAPVKPAKNKKKD